MKKTLRILFLGLAGVVGLGLVLAGGSKLYIEATWDNPIERPVAELTAPADAATIARGKHLYNHSANCWGCHGSEGGLTPDEPQAGGREFDATGIGPGFGIYYGSNLTSDLMAGVGAWTDGELVRAIREGLDNEGQVIFPVMAYPFYHGMSDEDALAIVAYMRTFPPSNNHVPPREPSFPARALIALGMLKPMPAIAEPIEAPPPGETVEYGEYLAWHASGCAECHNPRSPQDGSVILTDLMSGGLFPFPEENFETTGPNLTMDPGTGLGRWSRDDFIRAMRAGERPDGRVMVSFMPYATYAQWSDLELGAVWAYLGSLDPVSHAIPSTHLTGAAAMGDPHALFGTYCTNCHGPDGRGSSLTDVAIEETDRAELIRIISEGVETSNMPPFDRTLSRDNIAGIADMLLETRGDEPTPAPPGAPAG